MKSIMFLFGLLIFSMFIISCSTNNETEELKEIEQLTNLTEDIKAIGKEEIHEDDT